MMEAPRPWQKSSDAELWWFWSSIHPPKTRTLPRGALTFDRELRLGARPFEPEAPIRNPVINKKVTIQRALR